MKWWIGGWINVGPRYGVDTDEAISIARTSAVMTRASPDEQELPPGMNADAKSLSLSADVTKNEWERLGGVLLVLHDEIKPIEP